MRFQLSCPVEAFHDMGWLTPKLHSLIRFLLTAIRKRCLTTRHPALRFPKESCFCGLQSWHITSLVVDHQASFSDVRLTPMGPGFMDYVLSIVNDNGAMCRIEVCGDDLEGVTEFLFPPRT